VTITRVAALDVDYAAWRLGAGLRPSFHIFRPHQVVAGPAGEVRHTGRRRRAFTAMRRELAAIHKIVNSNAATVHANAEAMSTFQRVSDANMRRIAELQAEIDRLKKLVAAA